MIIRYRIQCATCGTPHTLRIGVGNERLQRHSIKCMTCHEHFTVEMDVDFGKPSAIPRCVENCTETDVEGQIVNVDPRYPVPDNLAHKDLTFPWMEHVQKSFKLNELIQKLPIQQGGRTGPVYVDIFETLGGQHLLLDSWSVLKKGWSLTSSNKLDLAKNVFSNYTHESFGDTDAPDRDHVLFNFCLRLLVPKKYFLFNNAAELLSLVAHNNEPEYRRFRTFFIANQREKNLEEYYDIFCQYFKNYSEFAQTELYAKNEVPLPSNTQAASTAFRDTKQFYGNAFEALTSGFTSLACINNMLSGRSFDQFQTMDLKKYLTTNKAGRANPFNQEPKLFAFASCVDSTIRNASHHSAMTIDHTRGIIRFRSGGTGAEQKMSYAEYLLKCNEIMLSLAALVALELLIAF